MFDGTGVGLFIRSPGKVLHAMQPKKHECEPSHLFERALTVIGLVASISALLSFIATGFGWSAPCEFFLVWRTLFIAGVVCCPALNRTLNPLFPISR
jgi:hypothetical protein